MAQGDWGGGGGGVWEGLRSTSYQYYIGGGNGGRGGTKGWGPVPGTLGRSGDTEGRGGGGERTGKTEKGRDIWPII